MNLFRPTFLFASALLLLLSCGGNGSDRRDEDKAAKKLLWGTWVKDDDGSTAFTAKGDTIYFNDPLVLPVYFYIDRDSLVLESSRRMSYKITKQSPHVFCILNQNNEDLCYVKHDADETAVAESNGYDVPTESAVPAETDALDEDMAGDERRVVIMPQHLANRDTLVEATQRKYRCMMNIKKTNDRVVKTSFNEDGIGVDKVYYDNIVELKVYCGATLLLTKNFRKNDFAKFVPAGEIKQCVLRDIEYVSCDDTGVSCQAIVSQADSPASYVVNINVSAKGGYKLSAP